jgi:hypothetical protein
MRFQPIHRKEYQFVKKGQYYVREEKIVNTWNSKPPIEDEIKKPLISQRLNQTQKQNYW